MTNQNLFFHALTIEIENYSGEGGEQVKHIPQLFNLLNKLSENLTIDSDSKLIINSSLAYLLIPNDVIPDHKVNGYIDDLYIISYGLEILKRNGYETQIENSWEYDEDIFKLNREILERSMEILTENQKASILKLSGIENSKSMHGKRIFNGEHYEFVPISIDGDKWNFREKRLRNSFLGKVKDLYGANVMDSLGINLPIDLTISSSGSTNDYRIVCENWGDKNIVHFLCPEIESYMTFVNWIHNESRETDYDILDKFIKSNNPDTSLKIKGNYRMSKEFFSLIIRFKSEIHPETLSKEITWERAPFLKISGEIIGSLPSPSFMSRLYSDIKNVKEEKVRFFTSAFRVLSKNGDLAKIKIFSNTSKRAMIADIKLDSLIVNTTSSNKIYLGLFEESVYREGGYQRKFTLKKISCEDNTKETLGHFVLQRLYYNYLKNLNGENIDFHICSLDSLREYFKYALRQVNKIFYKDLEYDFDKEFKSEFLKDFFRIINNEVYYSPYILKDYNDSEFLTLSKILKGKSLDFLSVPLCEKYKYVDTIKKIRLLTYHNIFEKESIIRILNSDYAYFRETKTWKWKI